MTVPIHLVTLQRIAAKAVITGPDGHILILREAKGRSGAGRWGLPGGRLELGEPFADALRREIDEETGLTVTTGEPFYVGEWFPVIKGIQNQIVGVFVDCKARESRVRLSDEHDEYRWIEPKDYVNFELMSPESEVIAAWMRL